MKTHKANVLRQFPTAFGVRNGRTGVTTIYLSPNHAMPVATGNCPLTAWRAAADGLVDEGERVRKGRYFYLSSHPARAQARAQREARK